MSRACVLTVLAGVVLVVSLQLGPFVAMAGQGSDETETSVPSDPPTDQKDVAPPIGLSNPGIDDLAPSPVLRAVVLLQSIPQGGGKDDATRKEILEAAAIIDVAQDASEALVRRESCFVPFTRTLRYGMRGEDVLALKLALKNAGSLRVLNKGNKLNSFYGSFTRHAMRSFQKAHALPLSGVYGRRSHRVLDCFYGQRAKRLMYEKQRSVHEYVVRQRIRSAAIWGYERRDTISYSQGVYRMRDFGPPPNVPDATDCSGFTTWVFKSGGAKDPNCRGYDGYGFTGTQLSCGRRIALNEIEVADLVFYSGHVAVYIGKGRIVSLGSAQGPLILPIAYRQVYQVRTYLG